MDFKKMAMVGVLVGLTGLTAQAAVIDDFSDGVTNISDTPAAGSANSTEGSLTGVIGTERDVTVTASGEPGLVATAKVNPPLSKFAMSSDSGITGIWTLLYDGVGSGDLGANLLADGANAFGVFFSSVNGSGLVQIEVFDGTNSDLESTAIGIGLQTIAFSAFTGVDFSSINSIRFTFSGSDDGDYTVADLKTVPAPAALPAGMALLATFGFFRRRRLA